MNNLSLFSGIGGMDLAAEHAGIKTVAFCEKDPYCQKVLAKHWPSVPIIGDVRDVSKERLEQFGITTIDVVSGGFPCQPFSNSGRRKGKEDDRYLWPEMFRIISELEPAWVVGENVAGFLSMVEFETACTDLESRGYEVQAFNIPACAVGALHERKRIAIVAYSQGIFEGRLSLGAQTTFSGSSGSGQNVADPEHGGRQGRNPQRPGPNTVMPPGWWESEPTVGRVAHGVPNRVDRLKGLGNAVMPDQFYPIYSGIYTVSHKLAG